MSSDVKHHHQKPIEKYKVINFQGYTSKRSPHLSHLQTVWNNRQQVSVCKRGISFDLVRQNGRVEGRGRALKLNTSSSALHDCDRNKWWFDSQQGQQIFPFSQRPCQLRGTETVRVLRSLSSVVERPGCEADHSPEHGQLCTLVTCGSRK